MLVTKYLYRLIKQGYMQHEIIYSEMLTYQEAIDVACFVDTNTSFRTHHNMSMYHARLHHI